MKSNTTNIFRGFPYNQQPIWNSDPTFHSLGSFQEHTKPTAAPFVQTASLCTRRLPSYLFCVFPQLWLGPSDECFPFAHSAAQSVCCQQLMKSLARRHSLGKSSAMNRPVTCVYGSNALSASFAVPPSLMIAPFLNNGLSLESNCYSGCQVLCLLAELQISVSASVLSPVTDAGSEVPRRLTKNVQKVNE